MKIGFIPQKVHNRPNQSIGYQKVSDVKYKRKRFHLKIYQHYQKYKAVELGDELKI